MTSRQTIVALVCLLLTGALVPAAAGPAPPVEVSCRACLVVDDQGHVLWERGAHALTAIASATKMVTALVVVSEADLTAEVEVSGGAAATEGGKLSLEAGETFSVEELLYALLLQSSNDAAVALAEHVAGSEPAFVDLMNAEAARRGATSTHFVTAHGLDDPEHYSTAADLADLASALLEDPLLAGIVGSRTHVIEGSARTVALQNTNVLLETYRGAIGVKTGFTGDAGNVLVAAAERKGHRIITVVIGAVDHFADSTALLDYGFARLRREILLAAGSSFGFLVADGAGATGIVAGGAVRGLEAPGSIAVRFSVADPALPLEQGETLGTVVVTSGNRMVAEVDALATEDIEPQDEPWGAQVLSGILRTVAGFLPGEG